MPEVSSTIEALLREDRKFPPPPDFAKEAVANDPGIYDRAAKDPEGFWAGMAKELHWFKPWDKVLQWDPPFAQWFVGVEICHQVQPEHGQCDFAQWLAELDLWP